MISETHPQITDEPYKPTHGLELGLRKFEVETQVSRKLDQVIRDGSGMSGTNSQYKISFHGDSAYVIETVIPQGLMMSIEGDRGLAAMALLSYARTFGVPTELRSDEPESSGSGQGFPTDTTAEWYSSELLDTGFLEVRKEVLEGLFDCKNLQLSTLEEGLQTTLSRHSSRTAR